MLSALSSATSGLEANQTALDVTSNNIANVNTIGFKASTSIFEDALSQMDTGASAPSTTLGGTNAIQTGLGVSLGAVQTNMAAGSLEQTGNPLDLAITGNGFFRVGPATAIGSGAGYSYTRAGNFSTDSAGNLVTSNGDYVIGYAYDATNSTFPQTTANETKITIPAGATNVEIDQDGVVSYTSSAGVQTNLAQISVSSFPNDEGLASAAGNLFTPTANSGTPVNSVPGDTTTGMGTLTTGALEMSNVDLAQEFTAMITEQQGYDASARVMTTANQIMQTLDQLGQ